MMSIKKFFNIIFTNSIYIKITFHLSIITYFILILTYILLCSQYRSLHREDQVFVQILDGKLDDYCQ